MTMTRQLLICLLPILLLLGCGDSSEVKEIRALRRDRDPREALIVATAILSSGSNQMDVWRELAYTNLELARRLRSSGDPFRYLIQTGVLCAALKEHKGKLDDKWQSAATITVSQIIAQSQGVLAQIDDSRKRLQELHEREYDLDSRLDMSPEQREQARENFQKQYLRSGAPPLVDPLEARRIVWRSGCYAELLELLRNEKDGNIDLALQAIEDKLTEWPSYSELEMSFVTDIREQARLDLRGYFFTALNDLREYRHFTVEHVLHQELTP